MKNCKHDLMYDIADNPIIDYQNKKVILHIPHYCIEWNCDYEENPNELIYFKMTNFNFEPEYSQMSNNKYLKNNLENVEIEGLDTELIDFGHDPENRFQDFEIELKCWNQIYMDWVKLKISCKLQMVIF